MERQFFHARRLINSRSVALSQCDTEFASDGAPLTDDRPAELSTHIRIYAASNDSIPGSGAQEGQSTADGVIVTPPVSDAQNASIPSSGFSGPIAFTTTDQPSVSSGDEIPVGSSLDLRVEPIWWNQSPDILGDMFSYDFFLPNSISSSQNIY